ncbi:MAG: bifunctional diguanylate cyclase/phosphodiesterase [Acetivibrionales bacterium]|jgi:diguanylate cyclase (GGDEF)-like protein
MAVIALITGLIIYSTVTRMLYSDLENTLIRYAEQRAATIEAYLSGCLSEAGSISSNSIISNSGLPVEERLAELKKQFNPDKHKSLSITDANGISVSLDGTESNIYDQEYYVKAMNGKPAVSDPFICRQDNSMAYVVAVPVFEYGRINGVLCITYDADVLSRMTDDIRLNENGYTFILNRDGDIIAHENRQFIYDIRNDLKTGKDDPELQDLVALETRMVSGQSGAGSYFYDGEERIMGFSPIKNTGWSIAVTLPKNAAFERLNHVFAVIFIFILVSSLIIAFALTRLRLMKINLQRQQMNTLRITDMTNLMVIEIERDGTIVSTNRYADDILDYFDSFGMDKVENIYELLSRDDIEKLKDAISDFQHQNSCTALELSLKRGSGKPVYVYCNVITDKEDNNLIEILGINITDRVDQEKKLQNSFEELSAVYNELAATEETIRQFTFKDPLTGLPNRNALYEAMKKALSRRSRTRKCALFNLDLDNLKYINDSFGHSAGDKLLVEIGKRLKKTFSRSAIVARFEGDEFFIFLNNIRDKRELDEKVNMIGAIFSEPFSVMGKQVHITASCGISIYPEDAGSMEEMLRNSDLAMHSAKKEGKNKQVFFRNEMNDELTERINMENGLHKAIEENQFVLHYQPQIELATGKICGFEALIRWVHPERGIIPPLNFIRIAEETGLIIRIGKWVLKTACEFIKRINDRMQSNFRISVNISVMQLMQDDFVDTVMGILEQTGLNPELLELELTESKLVESIDFNLRKLQELRKNGVKISIDDFGKGFSSLSYLKQLPINTLKIDKSFVDDIPGDESNMVESIIHIGHQRKLVVVAEGVENEEQVEYLLRHKCDMVQGFFYSRPIPEEDVNKLL